MRVVVQRVSSASVTVEGRVVSSIGPGLLILLGIRHGDGAKEVAWLAEKCANLRIFEDDAGKMNRSAREVGGAALVVSQFTLYGDAGKGRRPSFIAAAPPELSQPLYNDFIQQLNLQGLPTAGGIFGAMMDVALVNQGPVTIIIDKDAE